MRSSEPPSSPGTTSNKNVYSQPPPSTVTMNVPQPSISVGVQPAHTSVQHSVSLNMSMPPNGVVVTYNNPPPPFVPPPTTQSQQGILILLASCKNENRTEYIITNLLYVKIMLLTKLTLQGY